MTSKIEKYSLLSLKVLYSIYARSNKSIIKLRISSELNNIIFTVSILFLISEERMQEIASSFFYTFTHTAKPILRPYL